MSKIAERCGTHWRYVC